MAVLVSVFFVCVLGSSSGVLRICVRFSFFGDDDGDDDQRSQRSEERSKRSKKKTLTKGREKRILSIADVIVMETG